MDLYHRSWRLHIASHIARRLKSEGHYIIASDWKKNELMVEEMFCHEFHLVDLRVMDNCLKITLGVDHVFNLAADMGGDGFYSVKAFCDHVQ